jgi:hypothetical protein
MSDFRQCSGTIFCVQIEEQLLPCRCVRGGPDSWEYIQLGRYHVREDCTYFYCQPCNTMIERPVPFQDRFRLISLKCVCGLSGRPMAAAGTDGIKEWTEWSDPPWERYMQELDRMMLGFPPGFPLPGIGMGPEL